MRTDQTPEVAKVGHGPLSGTQSAQKRLTPSAYASTGLDVVKKGPPSPRLARYVPAAAAAAMSPGALEFVCGNRSALPVQPFCPYVSYWNLWSGVHISGNPILGPRVKPPRDLPLGPVFCATSVVEMR